MKKLLKPLLIIALGITFAIMVVYILTLQRMEFNFANDGQLICTTKKDFGLFSRGDLTCFGIVKIIAQPTPTPKIPDQYINNELKLSK